MITQVRRVRDLTVQASNSGAVSATSRDAIATEVEQLRESLLGLANQTLQGRPLFGGTTSGTAAYDGNGDYVGQEGFDAIEGQVMRRLSDTERIRVDISGEEAFGRTADGNLFAVVADIITAVRSGSDTALATGLSALDGVRDTMLTAAADVGARAKRVEDAAALVADRSLTLASQLAETEDVDLPKTIMQLEMQRTGYEAALAATAKALQPTLVDFLR
jgi:flagellar hook-associated protein 3 FlgL